MRIGTGTWRTRTGADRPSGRGTGGRAGRRSARALVPRLSGSGPRRRFPRSRAQTPQHASRSDLSPSLWQRPPPQRPRGSTTPRRGLSPRCDARRGRPRAARAPSAAGIARRWGERGEISSSSSLPASRDSPTPTAPVGRRGPAPLRPRPHPPEIQTRTRRRARPHQARRHGRKQAERALNGEWGAERPVSRVRQPTVGLWRWTMTPWHT